MHQRHRLGPALIALGLLSGCVSQTTQTVLAGGGQAAAPPVRPAPASTPRPAPGGPVGAAPGQRQKVAFVTSLNPDCSSKGAISIDFLSKPAQGTAAFAATHDFAQHAPASSLTHRDDRRVPGMQIFYTSEPAFRGAEVSIVTILFPDGRRASLPFTMAVQ